MATFLDLCQQVHRYARIGQDPPGTAPTTVKGQEGVLFEIVGWVRDAWEDIQNDKDHWKFAEGGATVLVPEGVRNADVIGQVNDFQELVPYTANECRKYILWAPQNTDASAQQPVYLVPWDDWRGGIFERGGGASTTGTPAYFTITPDGGIRLYPNPDQNVNLTFAYRRLPQELTNDGDVPRLPPEHHTAIVWRALMYHPDTRDKTGEEYQKWERRRKEAMQRLYRSQLPQVTL